MIYAIKKELTSTNGLNNDKNGYVQLMIKELGLRAMEQYNLCHSLTIFKVIFNNINKQNAYQTIEIIKELLEVLTNFGEKEIEDQKTFEIDHLLSLDNKIADDIKVHILKNFVPYWKVENSDNYQDFRRKMFKWPELKMLIIAKENNVQEFKSCFANYLSNTQQSFVKTVKNKSVKKEMVNGVSRKIQENTKQKKFDQVAYRIKLSNDCLLIANFCYKNRNEDILKAIIMEHEIDHVVVLKIIVFLCKVGFHESLEIYLKIVDCSTLSVRNVKEIMFAIFDRMMERRNHKSFQEIYYEKINHNLCFQLIVNQKGIKKFCFIFMKYALLNGYDEIVLQFFKNGYYIDSQNSEGESFLTICKNPDLLRKILDNSVTIHHPKNTINKTCLKIDYRFLVQSSQEVESLRSHRNENTHKKSPMQKIAVNNHFKSLIEHPVLAICINLKCQKYEQMHRINFWIFLICSFITVLSIIPGNFKLSQEAKMCMYLICPTFVLFRELVQLYLFKVEYLKTCMNWVEILLILFGIAGFVGLFMEEKTLHNVCSAVLILFTIIELLFLRAKISKSLNQILSMLIKVAITYLKIIRIFGLIWIGFSLSFYLIFLQSNTGCFYNVNITANTDENDYNSYHSSFLKTTLMMTGEFGDIEIICWYKYLFFLIFIFVAVTIYNFMNAIAIGEVKKLQKEAEFLVLIEKFTKIEAYRHLFDKFESYWYRSSCRAFDSERIQEVFVECTGRTVRADYYFKDKVMLNIDENMCQRLQDIAHHTDLKQNTNVD